MIVSFNAEMYDNFLVGGAGYSDSAIDINQTAYSENFLYTYDILHDELNVLANAELDEIKVDDDFEPEKFLNERSFSQDELDSSFLKEIKEQLLSRAIKNFPYIDYDAEVVIGFISDKNNIVPFEAVSNKDLLFKQPNLISNDIKSKYNRSNPKRKMEIDI